MRRSALLIVAPICLFAGLPLARAAELVSGSLESALVPSPVEYYALVPSVELADGKALPLVLNLHGGRGSRDNLRRQIPLLEELWEKGEVSPMVIVMPSVTSRCFYMDFHDGSEKWETFLIRELLPHLRQKFGTREDRRGTMATGISMGGMGSARLAFKYPEIFGAVAIMEPGIAPILAWDEMRPKHRFWRAENLMEQVYGKPVAADYWNANNPASLVTQRADVLRESGLKIYLEAGDEDMFWLYEGAEFLHQMLWKHKVRHEYRLYLGADHVGSSLGPRTREAFRFLASTLQDPAPDSAVERARGLIDPLKRRLDEADHYGVDRGLTRAKPRP